MQWTVSKKLVWGAMAAASVALGVTAAGPAAASGTQVSAGNGILVCTDAHFRGSCTTIDQDRDGKVRVIDMTNQVGKTYQDKISSIRNYTNYRVRFWVNNNFEGDFIDFPARTEHSDLSQTNFNDKLSSLVTKP